MNCKNCGIVVEGAFCSHCGQKLNLGRINFPNFLVEVSEGVFQVNKGFFYTVRELSVRPGKSLKEFLNGKRKNHFKPIAYLLLLSTLYFLLAKITNQSTWVDGIIEGWMNGANEDSSAMEIPEFVIWFSKNYAYTTLLLIPIFSLATYLSFKKSGKNYLEHIVLNSYITGHQALIYAFFAITAIFIESKVFDFLPLLLAISYTFWVFGQFFSDGNRRLKILMIVMRTILTYILYLLFGVVFIFVLGIIGGM